MAGYITLQLILLKLKIRYKNMEEKKESLIFETKLEFGFTENKQKENPKEKLETVVEPK